jgi:hypothetical protein
MKGADFGSNSEMQSMARRTEQNVKAERGSTGRKPGETKDGLI